MPWMALEDDFLWLDVDEENNMVLNHLPIIAPENNPYE